MAGISSKAAGKQENNDQKFQGQKYDDDLGLNWYQFKWRNQDPQIGRFNEIDPLSEKYVHSSTYAFSENKVIAHVELEGLEAVEVNRIIVKNRNGSIETYNSRWSSNNHYKLGKGTLYHVTTIDANKEGLNQIETITVYSRTFLEKLQSISLKNLTGLQYVVFGGGSGGSNIGGDPDYTKPLESFNYSEFMEYFEWITVGLNGTEGYGPASEVDKYEKGVELGHHAFEELGISQDKDIKAKSKKVCLSCDGDPHGPAYKRVDERGNTIDSVFPPGRHFPKGNEKEIIVPNKDYPGSAGGSDQNDRRNLEKKSKNLL